MRKAARLTLVLVAVLVSCLAASCIRSGSIVRELETPDWQYAVETDHYLIYSNISRELVERAAVVAERAYTGAAKRLHVDDDDPAFVKTLERRLDTAPKEFVRTLDDGAKLYELPDGVTLREWSSDNTVRQFELPDGRTFAFWEHAMYGRKVPVYLCKDKEELDAWFPNTSGPGRGGWGPAAGVIGIITTSKNMNVDRDNVAHEIGHQILGYAVYGPPVWLDEGLAMYARVDAETGRYRAGSINTAALLTCAKGAEDGTLVPVDTLVRMDYNAFHFTKNEWQHYAQSWALVHYLIRSKHPQVRGKLARYLDELKKGRDALVALEELYDLDVLQDEYVAYIKALAERELKPRTRQRSRTPDARSSLLLLVAQPLAA